MITIALDVCVGRRRRERLEQMGYKIVVIAQPSEADKDWLNRAFAEGAFFVVSADLDIPKLIEREKYPMCWVEYPKDHVNSASIATAAFNNGMYLDEEILANMDKVAYFDSRTFTIPDVREVFNYFVWRQQDATRNSIQMGAQALYNHKQLHKKNTSELQEMMFQKGVNWNDYPAGFKRGRLILKEKAEEISVRGPKAKEGETVTRMKWASFEPPIFTQERDFLMSRIPKSEFLIGE